ncbi:hypothetical protein [Roseiterribacter gracilis]|uniref:Uncharacterized protein n=1 Tax=Roseiterribacter gracilis TaxID=2812848 RepID=A0A8S8XG81_9PROT|nr:hypothetical protein TMPK1_23520 [Rhodospirillales bacterium TMPK1]
MKLTTALALACFGLVLASAPASAQNADDAKWIKRCVDDNKDEKQTPAVIAAYCSCMTALMDSNETQSVSQWEKTHKAEENKCGKQSGWVGK